MRPLTPLTEASSMQSYASRPPLHVIHAVNSVRRAQAKDSRYDAMEIDISGINGHLLAAHDEQNARHAPSLEEIFAALSHPENKTFWLDVKTDLTQDDITELKKLAQKYHIHPRRLLFEVAPGPLAELLNSNGLLILLQLPAGFDEDGGDPQKRRTLNEHLEELLQRYHPFAVVASLGKYPYLRAYFPHYNKAIYSSTTVRPSLKKYFLTRAMFADPSVRVWMQDEYTVLPF